MRLVLGAALLLAAVDAAAMPGAKARPDFGRGETADRGVTASTMDVFRDAVRAAPNDEDALAELVVHAFVEPETLPATLAFLTDLYKAQTQPAPNLAAALADLEDEAGEDELAATYGELAAADDDPRHELSQAYRILASEPKAAVKRFQQAAAELEAQRAERGSTQDLGAIHVEMDVARGLARAYRLSGAPDKARAVLAGNAKRIEALRRQIAAKGDADGMLTQLLNDLEGSDAKERVRLAH